MGNNICSCDRETSEATAAPMSVQRKAMATGQPSLNRDDSRARLMVGATATPTPVKTVKPISPKKAPITVQVVEKEEEDHALKTTEASQRMTPKGVIASIPIPKKPELTPEQKAEEARKKKEHMLEEQLRGRNCRPLMKLFKMMSTDAFKAVFAEEDSAQLNVFLD